jgi:hypothetical protein
MCGRGLTINYKGKSAHATVADRVRICEYYARSSHHSRVVVVPRLCLWRLGHVCRSFLLPRRPRSWSIHHVMELGRRVTYGDAVTYAYQNTIGGVLQNPRGSLEYISRPLFYHNHLTKYHFTVSSALSSGAHLITSCTAESE